MKRALILVLAVSSYAFAQQAGNVIYQNGGSVAIPIGGSDEKVSRSPVKGAPYSATIINESVQTLSDGNRIVQTSKGTIARDSQGRTRQDAPLPPIANLSPANAPHLVFLQDPVAGTSYTLNLTDKTAWKNPPLPTGSVAVTGGPGTFFTHIGDSASPASPAGAAMFPKRSVTFAEQRERAENLGSQTIQGVLVNGVRAAHTIPAGQIGNDKPISIVTEVWTSPDLNIVVSSKRSDLRMGEQAFHLTNIVRSEPESSLFTIPSDFRMIESGSENVVYRTESPK